MMNGVLLIIFQALFFIFPAGIANMFPVLLRKLPLPGSFPIHEKRFGKNKTRKGLISGWFGASLVLWIQSLLVKAGYLTEIALIDYSSISFVLYGFLFGVGALVGDLIESFVKRRMGIAPGGALFPRDQIDRVIGSLLFISLVFSISRAHIGALLIITPILHALTNVLGYMIGLKDVWW